MKGTDLNRRLDATPPDQERLIELSLKHVKIITMKNEEVTEHLFYCLVQYIGNTIWYYSGYYQMDKPALSLNIELALKLHSEEEAKRIGGMISTKPRLIVEAHSIIKGA